MSSADTGTAQFTAEAVASAKAMLQRALPAPEHQFDLLEEPTAEDMVTARRELGVSASQMDVVDQARSNVRGRPKGSKNRRTDDFANWILSFGQHPSITLMKIQATPPEVLIEASKRMVTRMNKSGEPVTFEESMSYAEAQGLIVKCAAELQPFVESKKPVAIEGNLGVDFNLIMPGLNVTEAQVQQITEGEFADFADWPVDGVGADAAEGEGGVDA